MHDFGSLVYLDLQKTGSTFVSKFLNFACVCPERKHQKHLWITDDYRSDATYFITVRHPLDLYSSLYRYGLDQKGGIFLRLQKIRHLEAYASFETFIRYMLNPDNAQTLHPSYCKELATQIGFMSFRYLVLSLQFPFSKISSCLQQRRPVDELMSQSIVNHVLRNETLNADLLRLSSELLPQFFDAKKVKTFLAAAPRVNSSKTAADALLIDSHELRHAIASKERLILVHYR